jgi:hypothetical protein
METTFENVEQMVTFFKDNDNSNYYYYNHLTGVLIILVDNGCEKGIFTRCDSRCANIVRQYHKELLNGVPKEFRLYDDLTHSDFFDKLGKVEVEISRQIP